MNIKYLRMLSHDQEIQWTNLITLTDFSKFSTVPHLPVYIHANMSQEVSSNLEQHLDVTLRLPEPQNFDSSDLRKA